MDALAQIPADSEMESVEMCVAESFRKGGNKLTTNSTPAMLSQPADRDRCYDLRGFALGILATLVIGWSLTTSKVAQQAFAAVPSLEEVFNRVELDPSD